MLRVTQQSGSFLFAYVVLDHSNVVSKLSLKKNCSISLGVYPLEQMCSLERYHSLVIIYIGEPF